MLTLEKWIDILLDLSKNPKCETKWNTLAERRLCPASLVRAFDFVLGQNQNHEGAEAERGPSRIRDSTMLRDTDCMAVPPAREGTETWRKIWSM